MKTNVLRVGWLVYVSLIALTSEAFAQEGSLPAGPEINISQPPADVDLRQAVSLALRFHPSVRQGEALVVQRLAEERIIRSDGRPVIEYSLQPGFNPQSNRDAVLQLNVSGRVPVYDFGQLRARRGAAENRTDQYRFLNESREESVTFEVVDEYLKFALWRDAAEASEIHVEQLMAIRVRIEMRVRAGLADVSDLRRTDVSITRANLQLSQVESQMRLAADTIRSLANVQGNPVGTLASTAALLGGHSVASLDDANEVPSVAAALSDWQASEQDVAAARANRFPSVAVGVANNSYVMDDRSGDKSGSSFENRTQFGVFLTGRVALGGGARHQISAARAASEAAQSSYQTERLRLEMALNGLRLRRQEAETRIRGAAEVVTVLEQARDLYWQEYILSKRQLSEVFEIEREIYQSRLEQLQARADELSAVAEQLGVQGQLVSMLQIPEREQGGQ